MIMPGVQYPHWRPCLLAKRFLHGREVASLGQALDGGDLVPSACNREHGARLDRPAVEMHHAGAALAGVAATWVPVRSRFSRSACTRSVRSRPRPRPPSR